MQSAAYQGSFRLKHSPGITGRNYCFAKCRVQADCVYSYSYEHLAKRRKKKKSRRGNTRCWRKRGSVGGREKERSKRKYHTVNWSGTHVVNSSTRFARLSAAFQLHRAFAYSRRRAIFTKGLEIAAEIVPARRYARRHLLKR